MVRREFLPWVLGVACLTAVVYPCAMTVRAAEDPAVAAANEEEAKAIQAELAALKSQLQLSKTRSNTSSADTILEKKIDVPPVKVAAGKLQIGGLLQIWYTQFQHDPRGLFDDRVDNIQDTNQAGDNASFRVRRAEIKLTYKPNAYVSAHVMIDPAKEADSFPLITDNQAYDNSPFKTMNNVAAAVDANQFGQPAGLGNFATVQNLQQGRGIANRMLQDAFINFHNDPACPGDFEWHHDLQVGQFLPPVGEEGLRSDAQLDFAERSFVGLLENNRDLGIQIHGHWWDDRFQYWLGAFNGAQDYHMSNGDGGNRSDSNNQKDMAFRALVRPLADDCWGAMELGGSAEFGQHNSADPISGANGIGSQKTWASRYAAWGYFAPGYIFQGLWLRGEWGWFKDRNQAGTIVDFTGNGATDYSNTGSGSGLAQGMAHPFAVQGYYAAAGYRFNNPGLCLPKAMRPVELAARYQTFQNVITASLIDPAKQNLFSTQVYTAGVNYHLVENSALRQLNYNWVENPHDNEPGRIFHSVKNDSFVLNFQVAF
jgi:hypothetical protein